MKEQELIEKAKNGDNWALNLLLQENYKSLHGFLIKVTGDIHLAEDILQETLLKVSMNIHKFRGNCKFLTYIIQISLNIYRNHLRKSKMMLFEDTYAYEQSYNGEDSIITSLEFKEAIKFLQSMPDEKRISFILKHYYGYSIEEISNILNVPTGTTKSRIHNTIQKLKKLLT